MRFPDKQSLPIESCWPIGSVFISTLATNPAELLGFGTWQAIAAGRVLIGQDAGQSEFDTLGETGGAKEVTLTGAQSGVAAHSHGVTDPGHAHSQRHFPTATGGSTGCTIDTSMSGTQTNNSVTTATSTTGLTVGNATPANAAEPHTNLMPFLVVSMWHRVS
jgi:microcystin-dependent protein